MANQKDFIYARSVHIRNMEDVLHESMMPYAEHVILDRALPRVEDGLKPVQRRILYTMMELGLQSDKPFRKSARIVGDCLGKYHPHGDSSVYEAMVRMAQPFNMRNTLVEGHGNFGSIDGDSAAAMRYTEARLAPLAEEMLRDLEKNTVDFSLNFDDTMKEPDTLPGRFPNLLVNGATGIAVGLATSIPTHNLGEVIDGVIAYLENPRISLKEMMKHVKAPDFPTGGYLIIGEDLERAYATGKGRVIMRAKAHIEIGEYEKRNIVITELPFQVNKENLLKKISELRETDKESFGGISEIVDESDRNGMRAVVRVKRDVDPKPILEKLFAKTDLERAFNINMVAIANGKPQQLGLLDIIGHYVRYQKEIITRRTKFDLDRAREREHVLDGLIVAVNNIDEIIAIIRKSESVAIARTALMNRFALSERQAQAILDLRLARLTKLEIISLENELADLRAQIAQFLKILNESSELKAVLKHELLAIRKKYADPRRSEIVGAGEEIAVPSEDDEAPLEDCVIAVTAEGRIKRASQLAFTKANRNLSEKSKLADITPILIETQTDHILLMFSSRGNCFRISAADIPESKWKDRGVTLKSLAPEAVSGEKIVAIFPVTEELPTGDLIFCTKEGMVKRSAFSEYGVKKTSFLAIKIRDEDEVLSVERDAEDTSILFVTEEGMSLNIEKTDIPQQGRVSVGVRGINLNDKDKVVFASQIPAEGEVLVLTNEGMIKRVIVSTLDISVRYRKGVKICDLRTEDSKVIYVSHVTMPYEIALITEDDRTVSIFTEDVGIENRTTRGRSFDGSKRPPAVVSAFRHLTRGTIVTFQGI